MPRHCPGMHDPSAPIRQSQRCAGVMQSAQHTCTMDLAQRGCLPQKEVDTLSLQHRAPCERFHLAAMLNRCQQLMEIMYEDTEKRPGPSGALVLALPGPASTRHLPRCRHHESPALGRSSEQCVPIQGSLA